MYWPNFDANHLLVTASEMSSLEERLLATGLPVASLMEKVGHGMVSWLLQEPDLLKDGVVVLVGPGHNGGDGLVVARELYLSGIKVQIWCPFQISKPITKQHLSYAISVGVETLKEEPDFKEKNLWIDALFGLAQRRPLPDEIAKLLEDREIAQPGKLISLDIPSGLCSDSGKPLNGCSAVASTTITVGLIKQGLLQDKAIDYVGNLIRIDIGFPLEIFKEFSLTQPRRICSSDILSLSWPKQSPSAMKYQRGRVFVIAGSSNYRGAAALTLKGALASGVGSTCASVPDQVSNFLWQSLPEIVFKKSLRCLEDGVSEISNCLNKETLSRIDSLLIGPGLGVSDKESWEVVAAQVLSFKGLLVLDADGINRLASSSLGWKWLSNRKGPTCLTPHSQEFCRLFPELKELEPLEAAREAAHASGAVIVLKGAHTVISDASGETWQLGDTTDLVARAGFGDLLAGYLAGLGAIGMAAQASCKGELFAKGAFLHSEAALRCESGTSASCVASSLKRLTQEVQVGKCQL